MREYNAPHKYMTLMREYNAPNKYMTPMKEYNAPQKYMTRMQAIVYHVTNALPYVIKWHIACLLLPTILMASIQC